MFPGSRLLGKSVLRPCHLVKVCRLAARSAAASVSAGQRQQVIVLTGPTAVGKTEVSLLLAQRLGGEIISADSVQVYRGLDIGSAKILPEERRDIPHHLLDILGPSQEFSAGDFFEAGRAATQAILQRGNVPIVVGGTGLYLRWFVHGRPSTPRSDDAMAAAAQAVLDQAWRNKGAMLQRQLTSEEKWAAAVDCIEAAGDPKAAARVRQESNNYYRLQRVLEVVLHTGKPISGLDIDRATSLDYDFRCFFLDRPRLQLFERIDLRVEQMVAGGLLKEAALLLRQGLTPGQTCATRAIGYRQAMEALQHWQADPPTATPAALVHLVKDIQAGTRQFATRQMTWFRDDSMYTWLDASRPASEVVASIVAGLQHPMAQGGCGNSGRLDKEQQQLLKRYQTKLKIFGHPECTAEVLQSVHISL